MKIIDILELKNTAKIEKLCADNEPLYVMDKGVIKLVIISIEAYNDITSNLKDS